MPTRRGQGRSFEPEPLDGRDRRRVLDDPLRRDRRIEVLAWIRSEPVADAGARIEDALVSGRLFGCQDVAAVRPRRARRMV